MKSMSWGDASSHKYEWPVIDIVYGIYLTNVNQIWNRQRVKLLLVLLGHDWVVFLSANEAHKQGYVLVRRCHAMSSLLLAICIDQFHSNIRIC
jgi:hypothetical protein